MKDRTKERYGKLTVLEFAGYKEVAKSNRRKIQWVCICDCGKEVTVVGDNLSSGNTTSCGCDRLENLSGRTYNKLTVLKSYKVIDKKIIWDCICSCGNHIAVRADSLTSGHTKSCGCLRLVEDSVIYKKVYTAYKAGAKRRGIEFSLIFEQFYNLIISNCHYCGAESSNLMKRNGKQGKYNGIDRLDSSKGYVKDNVISCCKVCNYAKHTMHYEDFKEWVRRVSNYMKL